jgi:hypothetical protein
MKDFVSIDDDFKSLTSIETDKFEDKHTFNMNEPEGLMSKLKMDQCKVFENFMKPFNLPVIAAAYEKACQKKSYRKRINTSVIKKKRSMTYMIEMLQKDN